MPSTGRFFEAPLISSSAGRGYHLLICFIGFPTDFVFVDGTDLSFKFVFIFINSLGSIGIVNSVGVREVGGVSNDVLSNGWLPS